MNDVDPSTQNCRRGSSKGHWVCTCTTDNLWNGSKLVGIRAGVAHLLVASELLVCSGGGAKQLRRGGRAASIGLEAAAQVREATRRPRTLGRLGEASDLRGAGVGAEDGGEATVTSTYRRRRRDGAEARGQGKKQVAMRGGGGLPA